MRRRNYRGHLIECDAAKLGAGEWAARATIVIPGGKGKKEKRIPVFGRRRGTFGTRRQADAYGFELAKLWIDGRLWGSNGHGS